MHDDGDRCMRFSAWVRGVTGKLVSGPSVTWARGPLVRENGWLVCMELDHAK